MDTLADFLKAAAGMAIVMTIWFGLQAFVRRSAGHALDEDVLDHMAHGCCGGCSNRGQCSNDKKERNDHQ